MTKVTRSSGNVFRDLGFEHEEAEHLRLRSALMAVVRQLMADRRLTQARAASLFGVTQDRAFQYRWPNRDARPRWRARGTADRDDSIAQDSSSRLTPQLSCGRVK